MNRQEADKLLAEAKQKADMLLTVVGSNGKPDIILQRKAAELVEAAKAKIDRELDPWEKPSPKCQEALDKYVSVDPDTLKLKSQILRVQGVDDTVLIYGQSGTGKELLARALHGERVGNFIALNCAGFPENLIESELFGHIRGAFTGAEADKPGLIEAANLGTLFLDEIGEMPLTAQAKLLRFLQDSCVRKVGATHSIKWKTRIVCATNRNLPVMVNEGKFRLDLYARISTLEFVTKPLASRRCDIQPIVAALDPNPQVWAALEAKLMTADLVLNVRDVQKIVRRYQLLGEV